jgi:hypothetical protein
MHEVGDGWQLEIENRKWERNGNKGLHSFLIATRGSKKFSLRIDVLNPKTESVFLQHAAQFIRKELEQFNCNGTLALQMYPRPKTLHQFSEQIAGTKRE